MTTVLPLGTNIYRGGTAKGSWYATSPTVASRYGPVRAFEPVRSLKLFVLSHATVSRLLKSSIVSLETKLLMKLAFGTNTPRRFQTLFFGKSIGPSLRAKRESLTGIDNILLRRLYKEVFGPSGSDGAILKFGKFHTEIFVNPRFVKSVRSPIKMKKLTPEVLQRLFVVYSEKSRRLLGVTSPLLVLVGGMAPKLLLGKTASSLTKSTLDFDFKFITSRQLRSRAEVERYSGMMRTLIYRHVLGFAKFLNKQGYKYTPITIHKINEVTLDVPAYTYPSAHKLYDVIRVEIGRKGFIDVSLAWVPGSRINQYMPVRGFFIKKPKHLIKDSIDVLARSFVRPDTESRNPLRGSRKIKGQKNVARIINLGHLTKLPPHVSDFLGAIKRHNYKGSKKIAETILASEKV